jgi:restriction system protein
MNHYRGARNRRPQSNYRSNNTYRPYKKRQTSNNEVALTIGIAVVLGLAALSTRLSGDSLPLLLACLALLACIVGAVVSFVAFRKHQKLRAIQLSGVDVMDGFVFEKYVQELLKNQGFANVRLTEKYDLGIDAIADKDGERWGIQIKRNRGKTKAESVRQAVTALNHYRCTRAMVVSNSQFTGAARQLAASNQCALIDRQQLSAWIFAYQHHQ